MASVTTNETRNQDATLYVGDLDVRVNEAILWELMLQVGPVVSVYIPRDKLTRDHSGYGFVEFQAERDAEYAMKIMTGVRLFGRPIRCNKTTHGKDKQIHDVGANLFIGNLSAELDERSLYDIFSRFGVLIAAPKIMRDPTTNMSKGFAFVNFDSFESSDAAIESLNGQFLSGRKISVTYALKKDSKTERHGSMAERVLAANNPNRAFAKMRALAATVALPGVSAPMTAPMPVPAAAVSPVAPPPAALAMRSPMPLVAPPGMIPPQGMPPGMVPPPGMAPPSGLPVPVPNPANMPPSMQPFGGPPAGY